MNAGIPTGQSLSNANGLPEVRVALLADHAIQQFTKVMAAAFVEVGLFPCVFEAEYGTMSLQAFDPDSEAHRFKPEIAICSLAVQKYRDRFFEASSAAAREHL